jgi:hypothetical protein
VKPVRALRPIELDDALAMGESLPFAGFVVRRLRGAYPVDRWGLDLDLVQALTPAFRARFVIDRAGFEPLVDGPAMIVFNRRIGVVEQIVLTSAVNRSVGRIPRFPGIPDVAVVGPLLRSIGGVLDRTEEISGLLRAGELVSVGLMHEWVDRHHAGILSPETVTPALNLGVPVIPAAVIGHEFGLRWKVVCGKPIDPSPHHEPLAATRLAERARDAVQELLDEHHHRR